ncbi:MAG: succinyl-diaminopimelate desuccinylase [Actinomycetales bacterium]
MSTLDLDDDVVALTGALVDIPSQSHQERQIADLVEQALGALPGLRTHRVGNVVIAATDLGHTERVLLAGHLDTVPPAGNLPHRVADGWMWGLGSVDMKSGVAVVLRMALLASQTPHALHRDLSCVLYDCEEVAAEFNGLERLVHSHPELVACDAAILLEPTDGLVEAGCQGTLRAVVEVTGVRAHSARSWLGVNAIHATSDVLSRMTSYQPRQPVVDGLQYREGLSAVGISGGVAGNVIPDSCAVTVNYRFAPDRSPQQAVDHVCEVFADYAVRIEDVAPGARPGADQPLVQEFIQASGHPARAKLGWTDVARFAALGIPALNFGPGNPGLAHAVDERVEVEQIRRCEAVMRQWLTSPTTQR